MNNLTEYLQKYAALSLREKILFSLIAIAALWLVFNSLFITPLNKKTTRLESKINETNSQLATIRTERKKIIKNSHSDPNKAHKNTISQLEQRITQLDQQLNKKTAGLIEPKIMPEVLANLLLVNSELELLSVKNFTLTDNASDNQTDKSSALTTTALQDVLFKHGLAITFRGNYFATMNYLQSLEELPWRFYWTQLDYNVEEYPNATVQLQLYTLSTEENWMGI